MSDWRTSLVAQVVMLGLAMAASVPIMGFVSGFLFCNDCSGILDRLFMGVIHCFSACIRPGYIWSQGYPTRLIDVRWVIPFIGIAIYAFAAFGIPLLTKSVTRKDSQ